MTIRGVPVDAAPTASQFHNGSTSDLTEAVSPPWAPSQRVDSFVTWLHCRCSTWRRSEIQRRVSLASALWVTASQRCRCSVCRNCLPPAAEITSAMCLCEFCMIYSTNMAQLSNARSQQLKMRLRERSVQFKIPSALTERTVMYSLLGKVLLYSTCTVCMYPRLLNTTD